MFFFIPVTMFHLSYLFVCFCLLLKDSKPTGPNVLCWSDFHLCDQEDPIVGPYLGRASMTLLSEFVGPAWQYFGPGFNPIIVWKVIPPIK